MKGERWESISWLLAIGSWVAGAILGRFNVYEGDIFLGLSKAVRVPDPSSLNAWWELILFFTLSTVAIFALSHVLFGGGGAVFLFSRGLYDSSLIFLLENTVKS